MRLVRNLVLGLCCAATTIGFAPAGISTVARAEAPDTIVSMTGTITYTPATPTSPAMASLKASGTCTDEGVVDCTLTISGAITGSSGICPRGGGSIAGPGTLKLGWHDRETVTYFNFQDNFPPPDFNFAMGYSGPDDANAITMTGAGTVQPDVACSTAQLNQAATITVTFGGTQV
jgi:hypothetical protein